MAGTEIERTADEIADEDLVELNPRQISALEKLEALGAAPRQTEDEKYDSDPQIRALQMVFEGRIGGPGRGQGRKSQKDRVTRQLSERFKRKLDKLERAIDEALEDDNIKVRMDAVRTVVDIEMRDAQQSLKEEQHENDLDNMDKEGLVLALIQQFQDPQVEAAIRAQREAITIPESAIREVTSSDASPAVQEAVVVQDDASGGDQRDPASAARPRVQRRAPARNGRGAAQGDPARGANPWKAVAGRRAAER